MTLRILTLTLLLMTAGCSSPDIRDYADNKPEFDLFEYFSGSTKGWGIVQDRQGLLTRQFVVDIVGTVNEEGQLVMEEFFSWSDGEMSERVWTITKDGEHSFSGQAGDVAGKAEGTVAGNALNWKYQLLLEVDGSTWKISFDDWMFLQEDGVLLNRARMSKFGLKVGEVTIAFQKP